MEVPLLKQIVKPLAMDLLALGNAFPTPMTDKNALQALVHKLFPVLPGKDLIRMGPQSDAGYLVPDDLEGIEACFRRVFV